jgi:putative aminopeptidase FrvX
MIEDRSMAFLERLLDTPGPSGFELGAARVWRAEAESVADRVDADVSGNSLATLNPGGSPRVMLAGHIDEIGLIVTHIDDDGYLYFDGIGGWDPQVLVGQRIRVLGRDGEAMGVVGKKPIHLMKQEEKDKASKITDLWIDVGESDRAGVLARGVRVGDAAVVDARLVRLGGDRIASRSIDNRIGAFVVLEAVRLLAARERPPAAEVVAVATTQ